MNNPIQSKGIRFPVIAGILLAATAMVQAVEEADLLVGYDYLYANAAGGDDNVEVNVANAVAASNLFNERSGTPARIRIAGFHKTWRGAASTIGGYVGWLANYGDGNFDDVTAAADARGADLVTMIAPSSSSSDAAGVAEQPGRYSAFNSAFFWSVVFAHETGGHNYGCDHRSGHESSPKTIMLNNYCGGGSQGWFSNPNIWLWGQNLQGVGSCLGTALQNGDAVSVISSAAADRAESHARPNTGPQLDHVVRRWRFDAPAGSAPGGTTLTDEVSGSALATVLGSGAAFTGDGVRLPGGTGGSGAAYIELPSALVSGYTNVTIEIWATPLSARSWARLIDINDTTTANNFFLTMANDEPDLNDQRFKSNIGGSSVELYSTLPTVAGVPHLYTITFADNGSGGGIWKWYRDGDPVAYLYVANYTLATMPDTKTWLGRSAWGTDDLANCDYMEVRISDVAMTADEVLANYELGMDWNDESTVRLTANDAIGTSSFNTALHWSDGLAPSGAKDYETFNFDLRTPATGSSYIFAGNTLKMNGGSLFYKGSGSAITVNGFSLDGRSTLFHAGSGTWTMGGNMTVNAEEVKIRGKNGPVNITAGMSGSGAMLYVDNTATLSGNNTAFTGKTAIGDGRAGSLSVNSEERLGGNPSVFTADQLTLNRGTLYTTATMAIDDENRGIQFGVNGGEFDVASGTTLAIESPLSCVPSDAVVGLLGKDGSGTLVLASTNSTFHGTLYVDTGSTTSDDGIVRIANNQVMASAHSPIHIRNNNSGSSTLQLDGSTENITLPQRIDLSGRNINVPAIRNLAGNNVLSGGITTYPGGTYYGIQCDAGTLELGGVISSAATGYTRTWTFFGGGDIRVTGLIENGTAATVNLTKSGAGRLILEGINTYNGTTTVSGGELVVNGSAGAGSTTLSGGASLSGAGSLNGDLSAQAGTVIRIGGQGFPLAPDTVFTLVDNFESYGFGANGTTLTPAWIPGWPAGGADAASTQVDADSGSGQALRYIYGGGGGQMNYSSIGTIAAEGATGTIFFQAYLTATGSDTLFAFGRSGAGTYGDLASLFRVPSDRIVEVHNGEYVNTSTTISLNTLYNFWVVIDNNANTSSLYYSPGGPGQTPVLIQSGYSFRNTTAGGINTFYLGSNSGSGGFIDNIYIDPTGANLTNPLDASQLIPMGETLTVANNFTLASGATLEFDVSNSNLYDRLDVGGQFNAGGTLKVTLDPDQPVPWTGDTFDLFDSAGGTVSFSAFDLPDLPEGLSWDTGSIGSGLLSVAGTPSGYASYMYGYGIPAAGFGDDANTNGIPNGMEYYLGWNPTNPVTTNAFLLFASDYLSMIYPYNSTASGVTGSVEWTTDLMSSNWYATGVHYTTSALPDEIEATLDAATNDQLYIRLKVEN